MVDLTHQNWQHLSPGTKRRWEPEGGIKKHNEKIHKESKIADEKKLPFTFSKPKKAIGKPVGIECPFCEKYITVNTKTVMVICSNCSKLFKVENN